jgi:hypothetical protein
MAKSKAIYSLNFSSIFNHYFHFGKRAKNKALALPFRPFLATFFIFEKGAKK